MKIISSNYMNQSLLSLIRPNVHGSLLCTNVFNHICRAIFPKLTQSMKMCIVAICYAIVFVHWSGYIFFSVCDANSGHVHWVLTTTWMNTHIRIIDNNAVQIWHMAAIGLSEFWKITPQLEYFLDIFSVQRPNVTKLGSKNHWPNTYMWVHFGWGRRSSRGQYGSFYH